MFKDRMKELRERNNLNKVEMAKKLKVAESTVRSWETGKSEPQWKKLREITQIFGVDESWLIGVDTNTSVSQVDEIELNYYGTVAAGNFETVPLDDGTIKVPNSAFKNAKAENCFALKVNGDSMNKILSNGSYIVIHDYRNVIAPELNTSDLLLIRNGSGHTIKRVRLTDTKIHFEPDSYIDEFKTETYDRDFSDDIEVVGKVIYNFRQF